VIKKQRYKSKPSYSRYIDVLDLLFYFIYLFTMALPPPKKKDEYKVNVKHCKSVTSDEI